MHRLFSTTQNIVHKQPDNINSSHSVIDKVLFLPVSNNRIAEGGLRTKGNFKHSMPYKPLVTIAIAVFNGAKYLEQTLLSVFNQDYDNVEVVVIDGGSTDGTQRILTQYDDAIDYWISEPDRGISDAFNKAVLLSSGDYLNFQGASDFLTANNVISRVLEGVDPQRDMLVSARVKRVKENNCDEVVWVAPRRYSSRFNKRSLLFRMSLPHQGLLTSRYMFERYGLFDVENKYSMDYEHLLRAYHEFPNVVMKDIVYSAWREGGVGVGKINEIMDEYAEIKKKNKIASDAVLWLISLWSKIKIKIKTAVSELLTEV